MKPYYEEDGIQLWHGDCREVLPRLADSSVDSIVTDPPYELGFMGKGWDRSGIAYDVNVWRECLRVLKPGGHLLAFGGSRTYHRLACAIEDAGFEIRDQIQWIYGSGFPKSLDISKAIDAAAGAEREVVGRKSDPRYQYKFSGNASAPMGNVDPRREREDHALVLAPTTDAAKQWNGWGTALKPAHEPLVLARKPLIGTVAENVLEHGTGGLNIDGCRIETLGDESLSGGNDSTGGRRKAFNDGWIRPWNTNEQYLANRKLECEARVAKAESLGRWPANVIHDGSNEVLAGFPDAGVSTGGGMKDLQKGKLFQGETNPNITNHCGFGDSGSAARFFYCAKASKEDREEGLDDLPIRSAGEVTDRQDGSDGLNSPRAGAGRTHGSRNHHPTVKPTELMRYLVRLITPPNGTVLDPFGGSGSTAKACALEGFKAILIEKELEYCEIAKRRSQLSQRRLMFA